MSETFATLFEQSPFAKKLSSGELLDGQVLRITNEVVIVDVGLKSPGIISIDQFYDENGELEVAAGDTVEVVLKSEDEYGNGSTALSRREAKSAQVWINLNHSYSTQEPVKGIITGRVKGGYTVDIQGVRAFLPRSLVDLPANFEPGTEATPFEFKVIKIDKLRNNVVLSRKAVVEAGNEEEREALFATLEEGQEITGTVKNLTDYGAFIDLGGIDGLLHITDMSWKRVKHPSEVISVGEELRVKVLKFDRDRMRVSLGLKQMGEDPWAAVQSRYAVESIIKGRVTNVTDYGCFVELDDGIEGLVHVSEMDWTNKNVNPSKIVQVDQEVEVKVLEVDGERRRISLGLKQCADNPWDAFANSHEKGEHISGAIRSITDFGIFVGLDGNIDGLVHMSDISWTKPGEFAVRDYKRGQEIETIILSMDPERERISLGIKQLQRDPFADFFEAHPKGSTIEATVEEVDAKGATVGLTDELKGYIRASEIAKEKVEDARDRLKEGEKLTAKVVGVDRKGRGVGLSIRALVEDATNEVMSKQRSAEKDKPRATLGDLFKASKGEQEGQAADKAE